MMTKAFTKGWLIVKGEANTKYRSLPEDSTEGEHTWDCPYCGEENQEWSGDQSVASPFRYHNEAIVRCGACGEEVVITEGGE